ncbi:MAG: cytochrome c3 family protein [Acidimicrobiia bacterium]
MTWRRRIGRGVFAGAIALVGLVAAGCTSGGTAASEELPAPTTTVVSNTEFIGCSECHFDLDETRPSDRPATLIFDHSEHDVASDSVGCGSCHPVETHVDEKTIKPSMETCFDCHGVDAVAPLPCSSCHPLSVVPRPPSHLDSTWARGHGIGLPDADPTCTSCHQEEQFCDTCHGLEMPHPDGWFENEHAGAFLEAGEDGCVACHGSAEVGQARSDCDTCHHPEGVQSDPWATAHADVVTSEGGESCSTCHVQPDFCTACHGVELPHPEGWYEADHAIAVFEDEGDTCATCHVSDDGDEVRNDCDTCHHPEGDPEEPWLMAHPDVVRFGDATCFSCHAQTTCAECHTDGATDFEDDRTRFVDQWLRRQS